MTLGKLLVFAVCIATGFYEAEAAEPSRPLVVAHRGLLKHAPENTLANFRACLELRLGFEFDVSRTKDGHLVCIHDSTVDRTTNGTGKVSDLTLKAIRKLDAGLWFDPKFAGEKVPTIDEVLKLVAEYRRHDVLIAVDLKAENVGPDVVRLAEKHKVLDRLLFIGRTIGDPKSRKRIRRTSANAHTAALANNPDEFSKALAAPHADWVYVRFLPTAKQMDAVHRSKKRAFIAGQTVAGNVPKNWQQATAAGIDGILTDYPLELRATLRSARKLPVTARLIARKTKYVLPKNRQGAAFRKRIQRETDDAKLPAAPAVDLVLELKNVSKQDVMIWPRGVIGTPDLEVAGPGIVRPESLMSGSGQGSATGAQITIPPGKTHRIAIKSLNPAGGTPNVYWSEPGKYTIKASYAVYTGLPPFPFAGNPKRIGNPKRYVVTTPPVTVEVVADKSR